MGDFESIHVPQPWPALKFEQRDGMRRDTSHRNPKLFCGSRKERQATTSLWGEYQDISVTKVGVVKQSLVRLDLPALTLNMLSH